MTSSTSASVIQCTWSGEQCVTVTSMTPVTAANEVITVSGRATNYVNTVTSLMTLNNFVINFIPKNIFSVFTSLGLLNIKNFGTATLTTDSFVNCLNLKTIVMELGTIVNVPEGFAQTCSNIGGVVLRNDNIESIHVNAFKGLGKMTFLDMRNNKIACIPGNLFQPTPLLESIYLLDNKIAGIDSGLLRNLAGLTMIQLTNNLIKYLPTLTLPTSTKQIAIFLYGNPINAVEPDFCTIFNPRTSPSSDVVYLKDGSLQNGIPCLVPGIVFNRFTKADCASFNNVMKTCYANYNSSMTDAFPCASSSVCVSAATMTKVLDFLRSISSQIDVFLKSV